MELFENFFSYGSLLADPEEYFPIEGATFIDVRLENDVAVGFVELAVDRIVHLAGQEILYLPNSQARNLSDVFLEELRIVQRGFLQRLDPLPGPVIQK